MVVVWFKRDLRLEDHEPLTRAFASGEKVLWVHDYLKATAKNLLTGEIQKIALPESNVLIYTTENGTKLAARPSGTEPKIKFYISVNSPLDRAEHYPAVKTALALKINNILKEIAL